MLMYAQAQAVDLQAKLFRGFADPSRLSILVALRVGAMTVGEIVAATKLSQSNVSNHLSCLKDCGLVVSAQEGRYVRYALSDRRVGKLLTLADELLADVAKGVYECTRYTLPKKMTLQSVFFFVLAAVAELGGAYLVWQWVREGRGWVLGILGAVSLFVYALLQTTQSFNFGRAFAAYGGIFIAGALLWGWRVDGHTPDRWDVIGASLCLAGAAVILWMPRE